MAPIPRRGVHQEERACSVCGKPFAAVRPRNGRLPKTCGPLCQAAALDKLIDALLERRRALLEGGARRRA